MDQHGLVVESRVQQVGATVAEYEAQMAAFFERLRAEEDPTRIAAMAERMPEPPDLAGVAAAIVEPDRPGRPTSPRRSSSPMSRPSRTTAAR